MDNGSHQGHLAWIDHAVDFYTCCVTDHQLDARLLLSATMAQIQFKHELSDQDIDNLDHCEFDLVLSVSE
jgi:hypothetical protein